MTSVVLANLLYKNKPHYSEDRTMLIRTKQGLDVRGLLLNFFILLFLKKIWQNNEDWSRVVTCGVKMSKKIVIKIYDKIMLK